MKRLLLVLPLLLVGCSEPGPGGPAEDLIATSCGDVLDYEQDMLDVQDTPTGGRVLTFARKDGGTVVLPMYPARTHDGLAFGEPDCDAGR